MNDSSTSHAAASSHKSSWVKESHEGREARKTAAPEANQEAKDNPKSPMQVGEAGTDPNSSSGGNPYFASGGGKEKGEQLDSVFLGDQVYKGTPGTEKFAWKGRLKPAEPISLSALIKISTDFLRAYLPPFCWLISLN